MSNTHWTLNIEHWIHRQVHSLIIKAMNKSRHTFAIQVKIILLLRRHSKRTHCIQSFVNIRLKFQKSLFQIETKPNSKQNSNIKYLKLNKFFMRKSLWIENAKLISSESISFPIHFWTSTAKVLINRQQIDMNSSVLSKSNVSEYIKFVIILTWMKYLSQVRSIWKHRFVYKRFTLKNR